MNRRPFTTWMRRSAKPLAWTLAAMLACGPSMPALAGHQGSSGASTPIQHVIVIVGENHTFDNVFGGYQPANDQKVLNLLSEGIIKPDGTLGAHAGIAAQQQATDTKTYSINPSGTGAYSALPQPNTTYAFGQPLNVPDPRFPSNLPNGPFQLSKYTAYQLQFTGDPVHRFFQMWQDYDEGRNDLFT